jgi:hypothetical protein
LLPVIRTAANKNGPLKGTFLFGGRGGNRTPARSATPTVSLAIGSVMNHQNREKWWSGITRVIRAGSRNK